MKSLRILGIDPGSQFTGYGLVDMNGNQLTHVAHGTLVLNGKNGVDKAPMALRLKNLFSGLNQIIEEFRPQVLAVEKVFFHKDAVSALKLGQARGVVMLAGSFNDIEVFEYSSTEVKLAVAGYGRAEKGQVAKMVELLLRIKFEKGEKLDSSDGLALAITHGQMSRGSRLANVSVVPRGNSKKRGSIAKAIGVGRFLNKE